MRILMTGGGSGFGKLIADKLREQGHGVFSVGNSCDDDYQWDFHNALKYQYTTAASELEDNPDSTSITFVRRSYNFAEKALGGQIDTVICHAGTTQIDWLEDTTLDSFQRVMNVNVVTPFLFAREFAFRISQAYHHGYPGPYYTNTDHRLIFTGSQAVKQGFRQCCSYPASKAALHSMAVGLAKEFAGRLPISVYVVSPGSVADSGMVNYAVRSLIEKRGMELEEAIEYNAKGSPMGYIPWEDVWTLYDFVVNHAPRSASGGMFELPAGSGL